MPETTAFVFLTLFFGAAIEAGEDFSTEENRKLVKTVSENCGEELQALERAIKRLRDREGMPEISTVLKATNLSMAVLMLRG